METMQIILKNGHYYVKSSNKDVIAAFGTDTIPTPFTEETPLEKVLLVIMTNNPDAQVFA